MSKTKFTLVSKFNCPWCERAVELLHKHNQEYQVALIESHKEAFTLLLQKAGLTTVPQIWYGDDYIGGYTELKRLFDNGGIPNAD